ncbi:MAG: hypothetical protein CK424_03360 [Legionella sp.]|nr:MAG: hypothetical protein CK424_03360 [Legionella sp.]
MKELQKTLELRKLNVEEKNIVTELGLTEEINIYAVSTRIKVELIRLYTGQIQYIKMNSPDKVIIRIIDINTTNDFYPIPPYDEILVRDGKAIKTSIDDLRVYISDLDKHLSSTKEKEKIHEGERETSQRLILGMAMDKYNYDPYSESNKATGNGKESIAYGLDKQGLSLSDDTIRKYLNAAKAAQLPIQK